MAMQPGDVFILSCDRDGVWSCTIRRNGEMVSRGEMCFRGDQYGFGNPKAEPTPLERTVKALLVATEIDRLAPVFTEVSIPAFRSSERFDKSDLEETARSLFNHIARQDTIQPSQELGEKMFELNALATSIRGILVRAADVKNC